ncbi:MAG: trypsin-like serine protease [Anaerolineales bacterium]|nr:trypsin-like serine protease [Anaerolineales bacterium]
MKTNKPCHNRFAIPIFIIICFTFGFILCLGSSISGQAASRGKATPTPAEVNPNGMDIVGGSLASVGEYPWQVALVDSSYSNPNYGQFCAGTLIDEQWVLSAGHCVAENDDSISDPDDIDVVLGINVLSEGLYSGSNGQRIGVDQIYLYPGFNYGSNNEVNEDASLLHLKYPAVLNTLVSTITLASPSDASQTATGVNSTVTGWGATSESGGYSDALREVQVPIVSYATCMDGYNGAINLNDAYHLCAGLAEGGKDSCYGDSGGPLIVPNGTGWLQAGIVSFGEGCAEPNYYGVYARVSYFKSWIDSTMGLLSGEVQNPVYLPLTIYATGGSGEICIADPPGESDNIPDALIICSGDTIYGTTSYPDDLDDVYKIYIQSGKKITISMSGNGGDSDLYLFPPGADDVETDEWYRRSTNSGNSEYISVTVNETGYWYVDIFRYQQSATSATNYQITVTIGN